MITAIRRNLRREDGAAAVELGLLLPVLLVAAVGFLPLINRMVDANAIDEAMGASIRYATKANPIAYEYSGGDGACEPIRRRRSGAEVEAFLNQASGGRVPSATVAVVQPNGAGTLTDPCRAVAGSIVTITATVDTSSGALAAISRAARSLPFIGDPDSEVVDAPTEANVTITAVLE